jgi:hypothetical protein
MALPPCVREGVRQLLSPAPSDRPTAHELLCNKSSQVLLAFPPYFPKLYDFYAELRQQAPERRPDVVRKRLKFILSLPDEGLQIVLPILVRVEAKWSLPCSLCCALKSFDCHVLLLPRLLFGHALVAHGDHVRVCVCVCGWVCARVCVCVCHRCG